MCSVCYPHCYKHSGSCQLVPAIRKDAGKLLSEDALLEKFSATRVAKIKKHCLSTGQWEFDRYEPEKVLYAVLLDQEFDSTRTACDYSGNCLLCVVLASVFVIVCACADLAHSGFFDNVY